ncbi:MAG: hypothetical protein ABSC05_18645 [Candidatus Solibacter sp.]|jgi:hypothetical protein
MPRPKRKKNVAKPATSNATQRKFSTEDLQMIAVSTRETTLTVLDNLAVIFSKRIADLFAELKEAV